MRALAVSGAGLRPAGSRRAGEQQDSIPRLGRFPVTTYQALRDPATSSYCRDGVVLKIVPDKAEGLLLRTCVNTSMYGLHNSPSSVGLE